MLKNTRLKEALNKIMEKESKLLFFFNYHLINVGCHKVLVAHQKLPFGGLCLQTDTSPFHGVISLTLN